jgi:hypothetical protein
VNTTPSQIVEKITIIVGPALIIPNVFGLILKVKKGEERGHALMLQVKWLREGLLWQNLVRIKFVPFCLRPYRKSPKSQIQHDMNDMK